MDALRKNKLVHGYITIEIVLLDIPCDIIQLIDQFLVFSDQWDRLYIKGDIQIDMDNNTITKIQKVDSYPVIGRAVIDDKSGIQIWNLKILQYANNSSWFGYFGIVKEIQSRFEKYMPSEYCLSFVSTP